MAAASTSAAVARQTWEIEINITTLEGGAESDSVYVYDEAGQALIQQRKPWLRDPHYFKNGKTEGDTIIVMDAFVLPVEGTETRVNAQADAYEYMVEYAQTNKKVGRQENVVGWYHLHPGYGCWLSGIDVNTQLQNQKYQEPFLAVVIDPTRTVHPWIHIFWIFFGWVNTLSSSPLLGNRDYVAGQVADLAEKLEQVENQLAHSGRVGTFFVPPHKKKEKESQLSKITKDSSKITVEQVHGLMSQVIKDSLFNSVSPSTASSTASSLIMLDGLGPEPMVEA
ncbi:hypothetical protein L7F22_030790 [Adiantum nelumboides]|nr:hypothetical protein [Adiantum nelumboides]